MELCLECLDAHATFDAMASNVTVLTTRPSFGLVPAGENRCRSVKTYRLSRVDDPLVKKCLKAAYTHVSDHRHLENPPPS